MKPDSFSKGGKVLLLVEIQPKPFTTRRLEANSGSGAQEMLPPGPWLILDIKHF